ncbi:MAG TPA: LPS export ABC transporter permease LptF [Xanthomonadaceae bacterium]|nr:LPS export ABC transporter permease LptF [Xanthomonadaceae bacterium]
MTTLQRYLVRQLAASTGATLVVLLLVSLGGVFADLVSEIARGRVPAPLLLSQLGLRIVVFLPMVLPLGLFIGLIMGVGRLYRDSEMAALFALGQGPRQLLGPLLVVAVPVVALVALCVLWLGPLAERTARAAVNEANRSFLVAGLEAGRFMALPGGHGVVFVGGLSPDGREFTRLFVQMRRGERVDVITAVEGEMFIDGGGRFLRLRDGFRVEGQPGQRDFRLQRFEVNEVRLPDPEAGRGDPLAGRPTLALVTPTATPRARAEFHYRIAVPVFALVLALLALPLARSPPRQARYGRLILAVLAYAFGMNLLVLGKAWLGSGQIPMLLGLWWLLLPALAAAAWLIARDGEPPRRPATPREARA